MNGRRLFRFPIVACVGLCSVLPPDPAAPAQEFVPQKQSLTIPIATPPARWVHCVAAFGPVTPISALAFSPDAKTLAVGGYQEVLLWDLAEAKLSKRLGVGQLSGLVRALAFTKDGQSLAVGDAVPRVSGSVKVFSLDTGELNLSFDEPTDTVLSMAISPDGKLLAASGAYPPVHVWNLDEKKLVHTIEAHGGWVLGVSFSADGKLLATAGDDAAAHVWNVEDWQSVAKLLEKGAVCRAAFGPDAKTLALAVFGLDDRGVRLRRTDNLRFKRPFYMPGSSPLDVLWDTKANRVYAACAEKTVKVFDGRNNRLVATLAGHEDWVCRLALSADGSRVASGSADGTVKLYSAADGKLLATLVQLSPGADEWLIITPQGYLATSSPGALQWKTADVKTPAEDITGILQKPELVQKAIAGEKTDPPNLP